MSDMKWLRFIRKLKPYNIQKGLRYLKHYGPKEFLIRLSERMEPEEVPYGPWREQYCAKEEDLARQKNHKFSYCPKISVVVPAYRTPEIFLRQMIESLEKQSYENWELVIGNASPEDETMARILKEYTGKDPRVKNVPIPENIGIAENTNAALAAAAGNFVGFMDHDDLLAPDALFEIAIRLEKDPSIDAFYTDEDKVRTDLSEYFQPHFKPDFNLDLLRSNNYICHFFVVRREIAEKTGGLVRNTMGRRIMIISSAARKWREKLYTFREFYITGGSTALPPQTIRQASCTRMRPEKRQLRETLRAVAKREPSHCVRIMASTM